jgi:putative ABC transport system permease protein
VTQIAASFVLLAGAGALLTTLMSLQAVRTGFDMHNVLAINVPVVSATGLPQANIPFYRETLRRIGQLPGVDRVAVGTTVPWRDAGNFGPGFELNAEGFTKVPDEEYPRARFRTVSPGFFQALGVPILAGRDFTDADRRDGEKVVIISQTAANRMFPNGDALNRHVMWSDPVMKFVGVDPGPRRVVGIAADLDDENIVPGPAISVYHPFEQEIGGGRLFVHTSTDPYSLVPSITRIIREMSADQPVERAATLADIRAEVLTPDRLNTLVFGGFAAVALAVAIVGVAGVLAFSVSGRTREFGIRLAIGSLPRHLLTGVLTEGLVMAVIGVVAGGLFGFALATLAANYFHEMRMPGVLPIIGSAGVLLVAAIVASLLPARRAARVDVISALRGD